MSDVVIDNSGEPLAGFASEPGKPGQSVNVWTRHALSSDMPVFHRLVENLDGVIQHMARNSGTAVDLRRTHTVLLIYKSDLTVELWLDTAAVSLQCLVRRAIAARSVVFESDIADVIGMRFPCIRFDESDKVLSLFREGWRFGLVFDFNPEGKFDGDWFSSALGTLYRTLRYRRLYDAVTDPTIFEPLLVAGWFPFVEIMTSEFRELAQHAEARFDFAEVEKKMVAAFDAARLNLLFERWSGKPHFAAKSALLTEAIEAFAARRPASVIKIVLTEIEGVLNDAYKASHGGRSAKLKELLTFAQASAELRAGGPNTMLFTEAFGRYLSAHTFANFDPLTQTGTAASRHAVGHGAAAQESYTMTRALQAILTLDQIAFYT